MKYRFFILGLITVLFAACAVNEEDKVNPAVNDGEEFYATIEGTATKAYVDDQLRVLWNADDRVSIFNRTTYNRQYRFDGRDGANSGTFVKVPNDDFVTSNPLDYVYSVYPYNSNTEISNDGELTVYLPAEQSYREDTFGLGANTMIAVADDNELMFKNLCGYMTLRLYGTDVSVISISLKGNRNEPLAGKAKVTAGVEAAPELQMDASATQEVTLKTDTPVTLGTTAETATTFWLVVPPTTFEGGITLNVKTADGKQFEKSTTGRLDISRNTRSKMAALEVVPEAQIRYLTFTSEGTTTVRLSNYGGNTPVLYHSTDRTNWKQWNYRTLTFTGEQPLYLRGDNPEGFSSSTTKYSKFVTAGDNYSVSGDIMSLIDSEHETTTIPCEHCFDYLFQDCSGLTSAPDLPATTLASGCYSCMFWGCTSLTTAPVLPATTLADRCYSYLFRGCTSLTTAPELPATTLASSCYSFMFSGCTSLTTAPVLPATTLASSCYLVMFSGCTSLTTPPELPATALAGGCYSSMFEGCTSLTKAPELPATTLADWCYESMFAGCGRLTDAPNLPATTLADYCYAKMFVNTNLTTAPDLPATTLAERCYYNMFWGCMQLNYVKCLATDISAEECIDGWLEGVASTGTFVKAPGVNWPTGTSGIPEGWTIMNDGVPEAIDLGLSVKWASFNLGASKPEEYGDYYAWGETDPYYSEGYSQESPCTHWRSRTDSAITGYNWASNKWSNGTSTTLTKYNNDSSCGSVDNKMVLDLEDDAAHVALGGKWRMPTDAEWTELRNNCSWEWTAVNGVSGRKVTSNIAGYTDKWIFLPAAGRRGNALLSDTGFYGNYWSSSLYRIHPFNAWLVSFYSDDVLRSIGYRYNGFSVRPVYAE